MNDSLSANSAVRMQPFIEMHFYQGGLRTEHLGGGSRPTWAPSADQVGFRDEAVLSGNDAVIEVAKFANKDNVVSWIGIYRHSPDEIYGNRGQHRGLGVWLCNEAPSEPAMLVGGLESLLDQAFAKPVEGLAGKADKMLREFLPGWVAPYSQLPDPLGGLAPSSGTALNSILLVTSAQGDQLELAIENAFSRLFYFDVSGTKVARALILMTSTASVQGAISRGFEEIKPQRIGQDILSKLPAAFDSQTAKIRDLERRLDVEITMVEEREAKINTLDHDVRTAQEERENAVRENAQLREVIAGNEEMRRHTVLLDELRSTQSQIRDISTEVRGLRGDLTGIRSELNRSAGNALRQPSLVPELKQAPGHPSRPRASPYVETQINWVPWALGGLVVLVTLAIVIFVARFLPV